MPMLPYIADATQLAAATDLVRTFGEGAATEAGARAAASRDLGNVRQFCRWRQVERLAVLLASDGAVGTVH